MHEVISAIFQSYFLLSISGDGTFAENFIYAITYWQTIMAGKAYRMEFSRSSGKTKYYLVKDIRVGDRKAKVRKYVGTRPLTAGELVEYSRKHAFEIELRAIGKKAELGASLFQADYLSEEEVRQIEEIKYAYQLFKELMTVNEEREYEKNFEIHYIHGTTAIEGNTLSIEEARTLYESGKLPQGKNLREINEVQNFRKVMKYRNSHRGNVDLKFIKKLHALIMDNIDMESAGTFRRSDDIMIVGRNERVSPHIFIEEELKKAIDDYYEAIKNGKYPFEQAVLFHHTFEAIHPFTDGNGRVGREVLNYMLVSAGFPRLLFLGGRERNRYIDSLTMGDEGKYAEMVKAFADLIIEQRAKKLIENAIKDMLEGKKGQLSLFDFTDGK